MLRQVTLDIVCAYFDLSTFGTGVVKVYQDGVKGGDLGGSAAQSVVLMLIVVALTVVQFRYVEKKVHY